jgi:hypothetical protein
MISNAAAQRKAHGLSREQLRKPGQLWLLQQQSLKNAEEVVLSIHM